MTATKQTELLTDHVSSAALSTPPCAATGVSECLK
jgi:hypothetical protein